MTTIPGNNIVIQQSGAAQELIHQTNTSKSSQEQAAAKQQANEFAQGSIIVQIIVQDADSSGKLVDITE